MSIHLCSPPSFILPRTQLLVMLNMLTVLLVVVIDDTVLPHRMHGIVFDVVDCVQELAVSAVHVRFLLGGAHEREDAGGFAEDAVHFFEGAAGGFGVEEEDYGEDEGVAISLVSKDSVICAEGRRGLT